jgi:hypothetical protein
VPLSERADGGRDALARGLRGAAQPSGDVVVVEVLDEAQAEGLARRLPLGHTAGQRMLLALGEEIPTAVANAAAYRDDEIGASLPGLAIASSLHETQYTRLFRS